MSELSGFWTTTGTAAGHQQASYTQAQWSKAAEILAACSGFEGVAPNYGNNMSCTSPGANSVNVNTGGAVVDGKWYYNDDTIALDSGDFASPSAGTTRIDRIVLRCTWASFTVAVTVITGVESAGTPSAPSITQTSGTTYDILLYQVLIDETGAVTLTNERTFAIVYVDDSTIEAPGVVRVKDLGITTAKINNLAVTTGKINTDAVTNAKIADDQIDSEHYVDGSIDTAHLADDAVDDTKVGNRVPQFYRRQGGSSTVWSTSGSTDYTPTTVRMQAGSISAGAATAVTFPQAFTYAPVVFLQMRDNNYVAYISGGPSTTGFTITVTNLSGTPQTEDVFWLAIGPE